MKILIVHDREVVAHRMRDIISQSDVPVDRIDIADSSIGAKQRLSATDYDIAFLDLTIPISNRSGVPDYAVAEQLLHEIFWSDLGVMPGDIIGITKEAEAVSRINAVIGPHLMSVIEERSDGAWERAVLDKIHYIHRSRRSRTRSISSIYDVDVLLLTALDEELEGYRDAGLEFVPSADFRGAFDFSFTDRGGTVRTGIAFSVGWAGQASAASATEALLSRFRPRFAFMSGICGGYADETTLGEALIFQTVWDWDSGKWSSESDGPIFLSRPEPLSIRGHPLHDAARDLIGSGLTEARDVLSRAQSFNSGVEALKIDFAAVASGSAVIASASIGAEIKRHSDKISGIDMESYGFYHAAMNTRNAKPQVLCVKAVSDYADEKKNDDFHRVAAFISASVVLDIMLYRLNFS